MSSSTSVNESLSTNLNKICDFIRNNKGDLIEILNLIKTLPEQDLIQAITWPNNSQNPSLLHYLVSPEDQLTSNVKQHKLELITAILANEHAHAAINQKFIPDSYTQQLEENEIDEDTLVIADDDDIIEAQQHGDNLSTQSIILRSINSGDPATIALLLLNPKILQQADFSKTPITFKAGTDRLTQLFFINLEVAILDLTQIILATKIDLYYYKDYFNLTHNVNLISSKIVTNQGYTKHKIIIDENIITALSKQIDDALQNNNTDQTDQAVIYFNIMAKFIAHYPVDYNLNFKTGEDNQCKPVTITVKEKLKDSIKHLSNSILKKKGFGLALPSILNIANEYKILSFAELKLTDQALQIMANQLALLIGAHESTNRPLGQHTFFSLSIMRKLCKAYGKTFESLIDPNIGKNNPAILKFYFPQLQLTVDQSVTNLTRTKASLESINQHFLQFQQNDLSNHEDLANLILNGADFAQIPDIAIMHILLQSKANYSLIRSLLRCGLDPNAQDHEGNTALHIAVTTNNIEAALLLTIYKANANQHNAQRNTPLLQAIITGNEDIFNLLLTEGGGNIYETEEHGCNALMLATIHSRINIIQTILASCPAGYPAIKGPHGQTALSIMQNIIPPNTEKVQLKQRIINLLIENPGQEPTEMPTEPQKLTDVPPLGIAKLIKPTPVVAQPHDNLVLLDLNQLKSMITTLKRHLTPEQLLPIGAVKILEPSSKIPAGSLPNRQKIVCIPSKLLQLYQSLTTQTSTLQAASRSSTLGVTPSTWSKVAVAEAAPQQKPQKRLTKRARSKDAGILSFAARFNTPNNLSVAPSPILGIISSTQSEWIANDTQQIARAKTLQERSQERTTKRARGKNGAALSFAVELNSNNSPVAPSSCSPEQNEQNYSVLQKKRRHSEMTSLSRRAKEDQQSEQLSRN
ncbi:ankyrin repeat domain-containing protein [Rickettsiales endosymbiont of Stachyamoeba lipophora]|uniref:ankyrin repeat domain-containing protein n=1 Tax=Rickettsiales endosymbiont of Stachyamoeba lipophora TaxID=2486578 RepID=UPI000F651E9B|nr:ankyrin repeat domain-containing protein [Rickettsiales endosymbiont of Stachyamoeba lipophora]AZL14995.1 ankyrin repeat domain-containing protein [Rickettsiales endosymbiont of Stachyamoeba lipophora]